MQSACKADAKSVASCQPGCKLHAKTLQSRCIPPEWMQTPCKPNAKTMQSASCSDPPRTPPPIWRVESMDQARRTRARGAETAVKGPPRRPDSPPHLTDCRHADPLQIGRAEEHT